MAACCSTFERAAEQQFNANKAAAELARFRTTGPGRTTRLLLDGIARSGALSGTLLDIGSGVGSLTFGLLERGITSAVAVDASRAYLGAAREEAERLRLSDVIQLVHGDFVSVADRLPAATVVTLDRVVCCYPSCEPLLQAALQHADRCFALSYPRDAWQVRAGVELENAWRRVRRNAFRTFVHPAAAIEALIRRAGFDLSNRRETWTWSADVYLRRRP